MSENPFQELIEADPVWRAKMERARQRAQQTWRPGGGLPQEVWVENAERFVILDMLKSKFGSEFAREQKEKWGGERRFGWVAQKRLEAIQKYPGAFKQSDLETDKSKAVKPTRGKASAWERVEGQNLKSDDR